MMLGIVRVAWHQIHTTLRAGTRLAPHNLRVHGTGIFHGRILRHEPVSVFICRFGFHLTRLQIHTALWAGARLTLHNLRMHGTGIFHGRFLRHVPVSVFICRFRFHLSRFQIHATPGTGTGFALYDFRMHGAAVFHRGFVIHLLVSIMSVSCCGLHILCTGIRIFLFHSCLLHVGSRFAGHQIHAAFGA